MKNLQGPSYEEVAFEICSAFDRAGVVAVLVGGGAATVHAPKAYQTHDLDFVLPRELFGMPPGTMLEEIGFRSGRSRGIYEHPDTPFTLEILNGPLGIGEEIVTNWKTLRKGEQVLNVIEPTDSVKDRLAIAVHFKDLSAVSQAAEVAKLHSVDLAAIKSWCESEGGAIAFAIFESALGK